MSDNSKKIGKERIEILLNLAKQTEDEELSTHYVKQIVKINKHYKIGIKKIKRIICKNCTIILIPGKNANVKMVSSNRYVAYSCIKCGRESHMHY